MVNSQMPTIALPDPNNYKVISLDIFDTSVFRNVLEPKDAFLLVEETLVETYGNSFLGFSDKRVEAELETCTQAWKGDRSAEFTLDDIYETLFFTYPHLKKFGQTIKQTELRIERDLIVPHKHMQAYFRRACELGKDVIFVSDIYLPEDHIKQILETSGYHGYSKLFVSCEVGSNKASGKLFDHVITTMAVDPSEILHIGDNSYSDIAQAKSRGINAAHTPNPATLLDKSRYLTDDQQTGRFKRTASQALYAGLQKNYLLNGSHEQFSQQSPSYDIGYNVLGPICYGFTRWIMQHAQDKNIQDLYFIAREGWFLKKAFDELNGVAETSIKSHYFYASRRALYMPFLEKPVGEFLLRTIVNSKRPTKLSKYFEALELHVSDERLQECGFKHREEILNPIYNDDDKARLNTLLEAEAAQIEQIAQQEKQDYLDYLQQVNMLSIERIGLVDSGWFGTGQERLKRFMEAHNPTAKLYGFYLALHKDAKERFNQKSSGHGYLYHFDDLDNDIETFLELARLIETFLSAPAESLKKFAYQDGELKPVFMKKNSNPTLHPHVADMQAGALEFVRQFARVPLSEIPTLPHQNAKLLMQALVHNPTPSESLNIGSLPFDTNPVSSEESKLAYPETTFVDLVKNPFKVLEGFERSYWRMAYYHNTQSPVVKLFLRNTHRYFWKRDRLKSKIYNGLRRIGRKLT